MLRFDRKQALQTDQHTELTLRVSCLLHISQQTQYNPFTNPSPPPSSLMDSLKSSFIAGIGISLAFIAVRAIIG
jgi:hypothetical protein